MKFLTAAISALLAAEAVYAKPITLVPRKPRANKRGQSRATRPMSGFTTEVVELETKAGAETESSTTTTKGNNTAEVSYSTNWAGAVLIGTGYTSVSGTFTVPTPEVPSGGSDNTEYSASAWVGLDGDTCETSILQTGVDFTVQGSTVSFDAWYEWYPDYAFTFDGFEISAGDSISLTATASSTTAGSVVVENLTTGKSVTHSFSGESDALCETNAEWIVEDYEENGSLVAMCNFGTVTFTNATAISSGSTVTPSGATIIDIKQDGTVYTSCSASDSSVTCTYQDTASTSTSSGSSSSSSTTSSPDSSSSSGFGSGFGSGSGSGAGGFGSGSGAGGFGVGDSFGASGQNGSPF